MTPESPPHGAPPQLPTDLFRVIAGKLCPLHDQDKSTLLQLALANKAWCDESQRILFRAVGDDFSYGNGERQHTRFLEVVYSSPTRLALYVDSYMQADVYYPFDDEDSPDPTNSPLRLLTEKTLLTLSNLKNLYISPRFWDGRVPFLKLTGCLFNLKTFSWRTRTTLNDADTSSLVEFLRTQHDLEHLDVGNMFSRDHNSSWLPAGVCPKLASISSRVDAASQVVATHGNIVALTVGHHTLSPPASSVDLSTFSALRYFRVIDFTLERGLDLPRKLVLLKLMWWNLDSIEFLRDLSSLRVLVLGTWSSPEEHEDIVENDPDLRLEAATESVHQCPSLACIIFWYADTQYWKMTVSRGNGESDTTPGFQSEEITVPDQFEEPWWTVFGEGVNRILGI